MKIVDIKHKALRLKSKNIKKIDKRILKLIEEMKTTLLSQSDPEGVGLAAPQVGKNLRIFIMHYPEDKIYTKVIINPKLILTKNQKQKVKRSEKDILEGCLSLPHYYGPVERVNYIKLEYLDENNNKQIEEFKGFAAQIVQHELDHLEGKLFIDYILEQKSPLYYIRGDEVSEVEV